MSSIILYKTQCPICFQNGKDRSKDNLAVYSDGHSYCYSCGYITSNISRRTTPIKKDTPVISLPPDITEDIPETPLKWLLQYFPIEDFPKNTLWSPSKQQLIFPIYDNYIKPTNLLAYQARNFNHTGKLPKWIGYGITSNTLFTFGNRDSSNSIVLVEDILSCYKVGHIAHSMCIFGSHISHKRLTMLALLGYTDIIIWLDEDKHYESLTYASRGAMLGLNMKVISTTLDPKELSYDQIKNELSLSNQTAILL